MPQQLINFVTDHAKVLLLTGAGMSTASGIGDYRDDQGNYKRPPPMTISEFLASSQARQRYWSRSLFGWPAFAQAQPNKAHFALANLQRQRRLFGGGLITQNVDTLHQQAGHQDVVALHGQLDWVVCLSCDQRIARRWFQDALVQANGHLLGQSPQLLPDGDADLTLADISTMQVPQCSRCGGILKPDVVFFGDSVPKPKVQACYAMVEAADALLVIGSSVMIFSSFRFCRRAQEHGVPIAAINVGKTRADPWLTFKISEPCVDVLVPLAQALGVSE